MYIYRGKNEKKYIYDRAKICEFVGCVLLYSIYKIVDPGSHGLYYVGGLVIVDKSTPKKWMVLEKDCIGCLANFDFS